MGTAWIQGIEHWSLILVRLLSGLAVLPVFSDRRFPMVARVGLAGILAAVLAPLVPRAAILPRGVLELGVLVLKEVAVGLVLGFVASLIFMAMHYAGQVVGFQMGFAIVNVVDPQTQEQVSIIGEFQYLVAVLLFLVIDGHHLLLAGLARSFELVPPFAVVPDPALADSFVRLSAEIFVIGAKVAAPAMAALFLTNVALSIVARTVPQMNIFIVGFPIGIAVGLAALAYTIPLLAHVFRIAVAQLERDLVSVLQLL